MDQSSILIVGASGQLGLALQAHFPNAIAVDSTQLDITDSAALAKYDWTAVKIILNAAAYTNVDGGETEAGRRTAWQVNAFGVRNLAHIALRHDITLVHLSTDYVFDGTQVIHTEDETLAPLAAGYSASKAAGDIAASLVPQHYILRTTWVIGDGKNFVRTMLSLGQKGIAPTVVSDQIGRLTFTSELVRIIDHLLQTQAPYGTYNATNAGEPASWAAITREIFKFGDYNLSVTDTTTEEYYAGKIGIATRPLNSVMDLTKLQQTGFEPRNWHDDLKDYVEKELAV